MPQMPETLAGRRDLIAATIDESVSRDLARVNGDPRMRTVIVRAIADAVAAIDVTEWAPLSDAERDLCRRVLGAEPTSGAA